MIFLCFMNVLHKPLLNGFSSRKDNVYTGFIKTKSDVQTKQRYWTKNGKDPPSRSSIRRWHKKFIEVSVKCSEKMGNQEHLQKTSRV